MFSSNTNNKVITAIKTIEFIGVFVVSLTFVNILGNMFFSDNALNCLDVNSNVIKIVLNIDISVTKSINGFVLSPKIDLNANEIGFFVCETLLTPNILFNDIDTNT